MSYRKDDNSSCCATRSALAIALLCATACAEEAAPRDAQRANALQAFSVPLRFEASRRGASGNGLSYASTASEAYSQAQAELRQTCNQSEQCIQDSTISVAPSIYDVVLARQQIEDHGFSAVYTQCSDAAAQILTLASMGHVRAVDGTKSLETTDGWLRWVATLSDEVIQTRDDLRTDMNNAPRRLAELGAALHGAETAALANKRLTIERIQTVIAEHQRQTEPMRATFALLAADYRTFHASEDEKFGALRSDIERIQGADLQTTAEVMTSIARSTTSENTSAIDLAFRIAGLRRSLTPLEDAYVRALSPYQDFVHAEQLQLEPLTEQAVANLDSMDRYVLTRQRTYNAAARTASERLRERRDALILLAADQATRETVAAEARSRAASNYLAEATARTLAIWANQPRASGVELLARRYELLLATQQTETVCDVSVAEPWMADGCEAYRRERTRVETYLTRTLPRTLRRDRDRLSTLGAPAALVASLTSAIESDDLAAAVVIHDQIAQQLETP